MCPGIFGYRGTLLYIPCDVISITCELGVVFRVNEISRSKPLHCSIPCIFMRTFMSDWYKIRGAADVFLETERKDFRMSGLEERERAVELYFTTPMTTAQVVEHLGYPTRQCLERWLAMDSRYAGHMAKPIIPLETRRRAVGPVLGGMQQKQAAERLGAGVGAVHGWVRAYRKGGMAALQPKNRNSAQGNKPADSRRRPSAADDDDAEALRRRVEEPEPGERVDAGGGGGSQKKTPAPTCGACRTGRRPC